MVARRVTSLVAADNSDDGDVVDPIPSSSVDAIAKNDAPTMTTGRRPRVVGRDFNHQNIANLLWSYASIGRADSEMFRSWMPAATLVVFENEGVCDVRSLTSIAWAYAVADVSAPMLFGTDFAASCLGRQDELDVEGMRQLYQWHLWQAEELGSSVGAGGLPPSLEEACYQAFLSTPPDSFDVAKQRRFGARGHRPTSRLQGPHEEGVPVGCNRRGTRENDRH